MCVRRQDVFISEEGFLAHAVLELWSKQEWEALEGMVSPRLLKVLRCGPTGSILLAPACNKPA